MSKIPVVAGHIPQRPGRCKRGGEGVPILRSSGSRRGGQGARLMTVAARSMGMPCWYANERQPQAPVQLDMHFIDAVQVGEFVEAKCWVVRRTRSLIFMAADLVVGTRVVATANGVWKTLGKR